MGRVLQHVWALAVGVQSMAIGLVGVIAHNVQC